MSQSYQHILMRADAADVVAAILPGGAGCVLPLADGLSALFMAEDGLDAEAQRLSGALRTAAATVGVLMSDHLLISVYERGEAVNHYDSHAEGDEHRVTEGPDGKLRFSDGTVFDPYRDEFPRPKPIGADPRWVLPFAVGEADSATIAHILADGTDEPGGKGHVFAEAHHAELYQALGLPALTFGYEHLVQDLPDSPDLQALFGDAIPFGNVPEIIRTASIEGVS